MTFLGNWQTSWKNKSEFPQRIDCFAIQSWPSTNSEGSKYIGIKGPSTLFTKRLLILHSQIMHTLVCRCVESADVNLISAGVVVSPLSLRIPELWKRLVQCLISQMWKLNSREQAVCTYPRSFSKTLLDSHSSALSSPFWLHRLTGRMWKWPLWDKCMCTRAREARISVCNECMCV